MDVVQENATAPLFEQEQVEEIDQAAESLEQDHVSDDLQQDNATVGGGKASAKKSKPYYNIIAVKGDAELPSENAKFSGNSPSIAAAKAARRIWSQKIRGGLSGSEEDGKFSILMRRVSKVASGRDLYKYDVNASKRAEPNAFFTAPAPGFKMADGSDPKSLNKRVRIEKQSSEPVYGYVSGGGEITPGGNDESGLGTVHRTSGINTLTLALPDNDLPKTIAGHKVVRSDHDIKVTRVQPTPEERSELDVANAAKQSAKDAQRVAKDREREKQAKAKAKEKERHAKEKAREKATKEKEKMREKASKEKEKARLAREKERSKSRARQQASADRKKSLAPTAAIQKKTRTSSRQDTASKTVSAVPTTSKRIPPTMRTQASSSSNGPDSSQKLVFKH